MRLAARQERSAPLGAFNMMKALGSATEGCLSLCLSIPLVGYEARSLRNGLLRRLRPLALWGPGVLVMLADTDAGNVVTASQAGAEWGYRLLPLLILIIPLLYAVQELTVRLGVETGVGYGELIRVRFGSTCAWLVGAALVVATFGSLVTEFTAVAGIGELFGLSRWITLPLAVTLLLLVATMGVYRRIERAALLIGLFEGAFFVVAFFAHPNAATLARQAIDLPLSNKSFIYLAAAIVGAVFNPWMVFYQQSAVANKKLQLQDVGASRSDTFFGAVLTQCLTAAILVSVAAALDGEHGGDRLSSVGDISRALTPALGISAGRAIFGIGVLGASMVAAIISSLAFAWGLGELSGYRRSFENRPLSSKWFYGLFIVAVRWVRGRGCAKRDLVRLNIAAQVLNVFLMPLVIGFLIILAVKELPSCLKPRGWYLRFIIVVSSIVYALAMFGCLCGLSLGRGPVLPATSVEFAQKQDEKPTPGEHLFLAQAGGSGASAPSSGRAFGTMMAL